MINFDDFIYTLEAKQRLLDEEYHCREIHIDTLPSGNLGLYTETGSIISIFNFDTNTFKDIL